MFWLLSHKHYRVLQLLILTDIMTYIFNRQINIHLDISHWYQTMPSWYECLITVFDVKR